MTMQKEKMRSLKEDSTVADDEHWSYPKVRKCARMIKSGQVPEDLQQLYEEGSKHSPPPRLFKSQFINKVFQSFSRTPEVSLCLLLEIPSVRSFQEQLWDLHQQISVYWVGLGCGQNPGKPASFEWCRKTGDVYQKDGYYHVKTIATAIEKKQGGSMVLHGGQAKLTKDEYSQMSQFMSSRPWSQFGTGASCGGSGSGSCGSGSSASSTPAVVTSSSALPKRFVMLLWNWAGQVLPGATGQRLSKTGCQNLWQERPKTNYTLMDVLTELSKTECMLEVTSLKLWCCITYLQNFQPDLILHILNSRILICSNNKKFKLYSFCTSSNHVELTAHKLV